MKKELVEGDSLFMRVGELGFLTELKIKSLVRTVAILENDVAVRIDDLTSGSTGKKIQYLTATPELEAEIKNQGISDRYRRKFLDRGFRTFLKKNDALKLFTDDMMASNIYGSITKLVDGESPSNYMLNAFTWDKTDNAELYTKLNNKWRNLLLKNL